MRLAWTKIAWTTACIAAALPAAGLKLETPWIANNSAVLLRLAPEERPESLSVQVYDEADAPVELELELGAQRFAVVSFDGPLARGPYRIAARVAVDGSPDEARIDASFQVSGTDYSRPQLTSAMPRDVVPTARFLVRSNEFLDPRSLDPGAVWLEDGYSGEALPARVTLEPDSRGFVVEPSEPLVPYWAYRIVPGQGLTDLSGNGPRPRSTAGWHVVRDVPESPLPALDRVEPADGTTQVPTNPRVRLYYDDAAIWFMPDDVRLSCAGQNVDISFVTRPGVAHVTPRDALPSQTWCEIAVSPRTRNRDGALPRVPLTSRFRTGDGPDLSSPRLVASSLTSRHVERVPVDARFDVLLSEALDPGSLHPQNAFLESPVGRIGSRLELLDGGDRLRIVPNQDLLWDLRYRLVLANVYDPSGRALAVTDWTFRTERREQRGGLRVVAWSPGPDGRVAPNAVIAAEFSNPIDGLSAHDGPSLLLGPEGVVHGHLEFVDGKRLRFQPDRPLVPGGEYVLTFPGWTDLAGRPVEAFRGVFKVDATPYAGYAAEPPTLLADRVEYRYSEPVELHGAEILRPERGGWARGLVELVGRDGAVLYRTDPFSFYPYAPHPVRLRFEPVAGVAAIRFVGLDPYLEDPGLPWLVGLHGDVNLSVGDREGPILVATSPTHGERGVENQRLVELVFDEDVDPTRLEGIELRAFGARIETRASAAGAQVRVAPVDALPSGAEIELTVGGVFDRAGNRMPVASGLRFTTEAEADREPPSVTRIWPPSSRSLPRDSTIYIQFSEPMGTLDPALLSVRVGATYLRFRMELTADRRVAVVRLIDVPPTDAIVDMVVEDGWTDVAGNAFGRWGHRYRTAPAPRSSNVWLMRPRPGDIAVDPAAALHFRASVPLSPASFAERVKVLAAAAPVSGVWDLDADGRLLVFRPDAALPPGATVIVRTSGDLLNVDGVPVDFQEVEFRVRGADDLEPTRAVATEQAFRFQRPGAYFEVLYNRELDPGSIGADSFQLRFRSDPPVDLPVDYELVDGRLLRWRPAAEPEGGWLDRHYGLMLFVRIAGLLDRDGRPVEPFEGFRAVIAEPVYPDPPAVVRVSPPGGARGVPIESQLEVDLVGVAAETSLVDLDVVLTNEAGAAVPIDWAVEADGSKLIVRPLDYLLGYHAYTLRVGGLRAYDPDVEPLSLEVGFETARTLESGWVRITSRPAADASDVRTDTAIQMRNVVPFDPSLFADPPVLIRALDGSVVDAEYKLVDRDRALLAIPRDPLDAHTTYEVEFTGAIDWDGGTRDFRFSFTTGDETAPSAALAPAAGTMDVAKNSGFLISGVDANGPLHGSSLWMELNGVPVPASSSGLWLWPPVLNPGTDYHVRVFGWLSVEDGGYQFVDVRTHVRTGERVLSGLPTWLNDPGFDALQPRNPVFVIRHDRILVNPRVELRGPAGGALAARFELDASGRSLTVWPRDALQSWAAHSLLVQYLDLTGEERHSRNEFRTGGELDATPPRIEISSPVANAADAPTNAVLSLWMSEGVIVADGPESPGELRCDGRRIAAVWDVDGRRVRISPDALPPGSHCVLTLTGLSDRAGLQVPEGLAFRVRNVDEEVVSSAHRREVWATVAGAERAFDRDATSEWTAWGRETAVEVPPRLGVHLPGPATLVAIDLRAGTQGGFEATLQLLGDQERLLFEQVVRVESGARIPVPELPAIREIRLVDITGIAGAWSVAGVEALGRFATPAHSDGDHEPPELRARTPAEGRLLDFESPIELHTSEPVSAVALAAGALWVRSDLNWLVPRIEVRDDRVLLWPVSGSWDVHRVRVRGRFEDRSGNVGDEFDVSFEVAEPMDRRAPRLIAVHPDPSEVRFEDRTDVILEFDEPIQLASGTLSVVGDGRMGRVERNVGDPRRVQVPIYWPTSPNDLAPVESRARIEIGPGLTDLIGNPSPPQSVEFRRQPPERGVARYVGRPLGSGVPPETGIELVLESPLAEADLGKFYVRTGNPYSGPSVGGRATLADQGRRIRFARSSGLPPGTTLYYGLERGTRTIDGAEVEWKKPSFRTAPAGDVSDLAGPLDGAFDVLYAASIGTDQPVVECVENSAWHTVAGSSSVIDPGRRWFRFVPETPLEEGATCRIRRDSSDLRFRPQDPRPLPPAQLLLVAPRGGQTGVLRAAPIVLAFAGPMRSIPAQTGSVRLEDAAGRNVPVTIRRSDDAREWRLLPTTWLAADSDYRIVIEDWPDLGGEPVSHTSGFRTGQAIDRHSDEFDTAGFWASSRSEGAPSNPLVGVAFSEPVHTDAARLISLGVLGTDDVIRTPDETSLALDRRRLELRFDGGTLIPGERYRVVGRVFDGRGRGVDIRSFSSQGIVEVGVVPDHTPPEVSAVFPPDGFVLATRDLNWTVRLSEPVWPQALLDATTVRDASGIEQPASGYVSFSTPTLATLRVANPARDAMYTLTLDGLVDRAGNRGSPATYVATTGADLDRTGPLPEFDSGGPLRAGIGIEFVFAEPLNPLQSSVSLRSRRTRRWHPAQLSFSADGRVVTLAADPLPDPGSYEAEIRVRDHAGNQGWLQDLVVEVDSGADRTAPRIVELLPASGQPVSNDRPTVRVRWSESIPYAELTGVRPALYGVAGPIELRIVALDRDRIDLEPAVDLPPGPYVLVVPAVADASGNRGAPQQAAQVFVVEP